MGLKKCYTFFVMKKENLIGKKVEIKKNIDSIFAGDWGIIRLFDGEDYHIAIADNSLETQIFSRHEFIVRNKNGK